MDKKEKVDITGDGRDMERLRAAKLLEKKNKKLTRVNILNGYVLTTSPSKWHEFEIKPKSNGSTGLPDSKTFKTRKKSG